ncbi:hypothetical protein C8P63_11293 [Melghirimyces profundicolus]|uniref:Uncharacterized protein n=1 Tax=Melghirimyces profundicolus TaxID=1242148 RepID=A0A2T6BTU3_9BACL|nr:hypothetical protein [Melghirimyces profundicolus]PTX59397.1 hypothetical protein C8P63_11293 [Melghirimyces profundicolus]
MEYHQIFIELDVKEKSLSEGLEAVIRQVEKKKEAEYTFIQQVIPHDERNFTVVVNYR